ncbi:MAG: trimeric intracellular cation channel family protein [Beijerinckiaceae bacterium]
MERLIAILSTFKLTVEMVQPLIGAADLAAAAVFAITGALVASRKRLDIVGFIWLGVVTGVGGGTVRDLLIGAPVFWIANTWPVVVCVAASIIVYFAVQFVRNRYRLILWLDAAGLSLVAIAGTAKGLDAGAGPLVAVVMGVITASVGGILRDVLGHEESVILRREIYVTAALAGAVLYVVCIGLGAPRLWAGAAGVATVFGIRACALAFGWSLPGPPVRSPAGGDDAG